MPSIIGQKIKKTREQRLISQKQLASIIGLTPGGLSLIEKGERKPSKKILQAIARVLNLPFGYFLLPGKGKREKERNQRAAIIFREFRSLTEQDKSLIKKHIQELDEPEDYARALRSELGYSDEPVIASLVAKELGIDIREDNFTGFTGALLSVELKYLILIKKDLSIRKRNFTIAHELGHWYIPYHSETKYFCQANDIFKYAAQNEVERQAQRFAAEFLMPTRAYKKKITGKKPSIEIIIELSNYFNVSIHAAAIKYVELTRYPCALILSDNGIKKWFFKSHLFTHFIELNKAPSENTIAYRLFNDLKIEHNSELNSGTNPGPHNVPTSAWLNIINNRKMELIEDSIYFPTYSTVLSLILEK